LSALLGTAVAMTIARTKKLLNLIQPPQRVSGPN
jgi:hypothetical protein